jgi:2-hydroxy-3-oxopropionate reductase
LLFFETAEKREIARVVAQLPQTLQAMGVSAWLIGRSFSNLVWQSAHRYSYNGMCIAPNSLIWLPNCAIVQCLSLAVKQGFLAADGLPEARRLWRNTMSFRTIGFIGLGIMGKPMAGNLLAAGYSLVVYNRSRPAQDELVGRGARAASSPREVAQQSDLVITMLPDSPDVEKVALGADGLVEGAHTGLVYMDMSTIAPSTARRVSTALAERGARCLDAPVSGGDVGAREGTLSIMVGGDRDTFEQVQHVLSVLGKTAVLCGPSGSGQTVKACNQVLTAVTVAGVSEALALGIKAGVDPAIIVQVLGAGLARCGILENRGQRIVRGDFEPGFRIRLHHKDLGIVRQTSRECGSPLPVTAVVSELFAAALAQGLGESDHTALLAVLEGLAGLDPAPKEDD